MEKDDYETFVGDIKTAMMGLLSGTKSFQDINPNIQEYLLYLSSKQPTQDQKILQDVFQTNFKKQIKQKLEVNGFSKAKCKSIISRGDLLEENVHCYVPTRPIFCQHSNERQPVALSMDATGLSSKVKIFNENQVKGVSDLEAQLFKEEAITKDQLHPLTHMFAFAVTPVDNQYKSFITHLHYNTHGNFDGEIIQLKDNIIDELHKQGCDVKFISYDGDRKLFSEMTKNNANEIIEKIKQKPSINPLEILNSFTDVIIAPDGLHILKRIRCFILHNMCIIDISDNDIEQSQILSIESYKKFASWVPQFSLNTNHQFAMSDRAAMNMLNPQYIQECMENKLYSFAFLSFLVFPLFVPFIEMDEDDKFFLILVSFSLQKKYYFYIQQYMKTVENVKQMVQQKNRDFQFKQLINDNMLLEIMMATIALVKLMCDYENSNGFALSSNPCECFFGRNKKQCNGEETQMRTESVYLQMIEEEILNYHKQDQHSNRSKQYLYACNFQGNHQITYDLQRKATNYADAMFQLATNKKLDVSGVSAERNLKYQSVMKLIENSKLHQCQLLANYRVSEGIVLAKTDYSKSNQGSLQKIQQKGCKMEEKMK